MVGFSVGCFVYRCLNFVGWWCRDWFAVSCCCMIFELLNFIALGLCIVCFSFGLNFGFCFDLVV